MWEFNQRPPSIYNEISTEVSASTLHVDSHSVAFWSKTGQPEIQGENCLRTKNLLARWLLTAASLIQKKRGRSTRGCSPNEKARYTEICSSALFLQVWSSDSSTGSTWGLVRNSDSHCRPTKSQSAFFTRPQGTRVHLTFEKVLFYIIFPLLFSRNLCS